MILAPSGRFLGVARRGPLLRAGLVSGVAWAGAVDWLVLPRLAPPLEAFAGVALLAPVAAAAMVAAAWLLWRAARDPVAERTPRLFLGGLTLGAGGFQVVEALAEPLSLPGLPGWWGDALLDCGAALVVAGCGLVAWRRR